MMVNSIQFYRNFKYYNWIQLYDLEFYYKHKNYINSIQFYRDLKYCNWIQLYNLIFYYNYKNYIRLSN
jgi:hypothetical protein